MVPGKKCFQTIFVRTLFAKIMSKNCLAHTIFMVPEQNFLFQKNLLCLKNGVFSRHRKIFRKRIFVEQNHFFLVKNVFKNIL